MNFPGDDQELARIEEARRVRRLRIMVDLVVGVLHQDRRLTLPEARDLVRSTERAILRLFPGKQFTYDLVLRSRFDRILRERWGKGLDEVVH